jgi:hypothetical protein
MKNILLLTSTIKPKSDQPQLKLTDPQSRLEDYRNALAFYSNALKEGTIDRIVFVDNSGYDLKSLKESFPSTQIEWLSFYGLDYPPAYHRGYGEFALIDYAFANSDTLRALSPDDVIWKVTGRYIVKNLKRVICYAPKQFNLYCDIKKHWVDMGVMAWRFAGYKQLIEGVSENFKTEMAPELILARLIREQSKSGGIVTTFLWLPLMIGRRGTDGGHFQGKFTYLKFLAICCVNCLKLPFRRI